MASIHILSKSTFLKGVQCDKALYLYKHYYNLRDEISPEKLAIFNRGTNVGILAQQLFPDGVDSSPESPFKYAEAIEQTQKYLAEGHKVIYEACFVYDGVLVALDILVQHKGKWYAYEVKSSTKVTDVYKLDAALQYWVITKAGTPLEDIFVTHINNKYVKDGPIDVRQLFTKVSVKTECLSQQDLIDKKIPYLKEVIGKQATPNIPIGPHCFSPYECDFMGHCWKDVPKNSVFEIGGMHKAEQFRMYDQGIVKIEDVPRTYPLTEAQRIQVEQFKKQEPLVRQAEINAFVKGLKYPLTFFDIETFMPAVPIYDGSRPYEQIPFQYSVHLKESRHGELRHLEFLAEVGIDPRPSFAENMVKHLEGTGDILVYNQTFEMTILRRVAKQFPQYGLAIANILERVKDLMVPFKEKWYYHPSMKGSYSIKEVLPALVPELGYSELNISAGGMAMAAFEQLQTETDLFKIAEVRHDLLKYCELDTLAMVKILEVLESQAEF